MINSSIINLFDNLEKCANWAFIPCFGPGNKYHKYSDPIFYPHDIEIASLFIDQLLIINPSGKNQTV